jgi:hypothetical protein
MKKLIFFLCLVSSFAYGQNPDQQYTLRRYVDSLAATISAGAVTLTGDVTGSGTGTVATSVVNLLGNAIPANASGQLTNNGSGTLSWAAAGGSGTVTSASVVTANGFAGTVATATTTPAITLTTSITGVLKGNATAISAASDGTDFLSPTTGWKLSGTSTLTAATTITASTNNYPLDITSGAFTAGANSTYFQNFGGGALTGRGSQAGDIYYGSKFTHALTTGTNAQTLVGVLVSPTYLGTGTMISISNTPSYPSTATAYLAKHTASINSFLLYEMQNTNSGSSADTRLRIGNDGSAFKFQVIVNSSTNSTLGGTNSTNFVAGTSGAMTFGTNAATRQTIDVSGNQTFTQAIQSANHNFYSFTQSAHTGGNPGGVVFTGGAHTGLGTTANIVDFNINGNRTVQRAAGAVALQTQVIFQAATYSFVGASVQTLAATLHISGAPNAGTNNTTTVGVGLNIAAGAVGAGTTTSYGLYSNAQTGGGTNWAAGFNGDVSISGALSLGGAFSISGKAIFPASGSGAASWGAPHGTAPSSPVNGDFWTTTAGPFMQVNAVTWTLSSDNVASTISAVKTFTAKPIVPTPTGGTEATNKDYVDGAIIAGGITATEGTYTPTLTNNTNVAASQAYVTGYYRLGNSVTVYGKIDIDATLAASTATEMGISLPIASDLAAEEDLGGSAVSDAVASLTARIKADATNNRASVVFKALSLTNDSYGFEFSYQVK